MMCYVTDEGATNLVEAARNSASLAVLAGMVTLLALATALSSWAAWRAAREMRRLRAETPNAPSYGTDPYGSTSDRPQPRWEK